jgi:tetratricopeptide (TPR) repeat protein
VYFISYSRADGEALALELADQLAAGPPSIDVWLDRRRLQPGVDWDEQLVEALRSCEGVLFVMTSDSVSPKSECKREWTRALKYKKPVIPLLFEADAELPYRLEPREYIDFACDYKAGLARLREHIRWRATPEGVLHTLEERLEDAKRDLARADATEATRIEDEIAHLGQQISEQRRIIADPRGAEHRTDRSIRTQLERQREEQPVQPHPQIRFINPPPMVAPTWFQDRHVETGLMGDFLKDDAIRMITVVGRGGVGKTAMACRLLKSLERGQLPDDLGPLDVAGILYLSGTNLAAHGLSFPSLFFGLCKLLPEDTARRLEQLYKEPEESLESQMRALLAAFPGGPTIVLLDNVESIIHTETLTIRDGQLDEALRTILRAPQHGVKIIITTRVAPKSLLLTEPGRQQRLDFDQGLEQAFAANILRELDRDGRLGLKTAPDALLAQACERTRGYPRALEALAGILSADRDTSLTDILADTASVLPENVVEVLVGEAFNRLDVAAQQVMQALAVYGAPVPAVAVDYLLRPYTIGIDSSPVLGRLVNMHFARRDASRYYLHQIDREYARRCIPEGEASDRAPKGEPTFTRYALLHRAAEYFRETRKPRESWKSLDDLAPCLAEFELRCAGKDYDAAARVLLATKDCLETWGHYRLLVDLHQRVHGRLIDTNLELSTVVALAWSHYRMGQHQLAFPLFEEALARARSTGNRAAEAGVELGLGHCSRSDGDCAKAIDHYTTVRALARDGEDRGNAAAAVGSLATIMYDLGKMTKAIQYGKEALRITREIGDRQNECLHLVNFGCAFHRYGEVEKARRHYQEASEIADEIGYGLIRAASRIGLGELLNFERRWSEAIPFFQEVIRLADEMNFAQAQIEGRLCLAQALLGMDDLCGAEAAIDEARRYSFRLNSPNVFALTGVIALRRSDFHSARNAFKTAVAQADELLDRSCSMWNALYAKALAFAGLALCDDAGLIVEAAEIYRRAYAINSSPGTVQGVLHELDALRKVDRTSLLKLVFAIFDEARWPGDEPHQPPDSDTGRAGKQGRPRPSTVSRPPGTALRPRSQPRTPCSRPGTAGA